METKERILKNALDMFARSGYDSVSIRDIAAAVDIKESSIYYHFKNKQDILDSLVLQYQNYTSELIKMLQDSMHAMDTERSFSWDWLQEYYFEKYLFDSFCNQMMRFMMIEQFHNEQMQMLYNHFLFELPKEIQTGAFTKLARLGIMEKQQAQRLGNDFFANMTMLTFKYLLNGELTQEKKDGFCKEAFACLNAMF